MKIELDLQNPYDFSGLPSVEALSSWVGCALQQAQFNQELIELTIRVVNEAESQAINNQYRGKNKPTNVLSFPFEPPAEVPCDLLGDLIICEPVMSEEATAQSKSFESHWAHLVVHGTLHLLGYDHVESQEAEAMESLEIEILNQLGIANPYASSF